MVSDPPLSFRSGSRSPPFCIRQSGRFCGELNWRGKAAAGEEVEDVVRVFARSVRQVARPGRAARTSGISLQSSADAPCPFHPLTPPTCDDDEDDVLEILTQSLPPFRLSFPARSREGRNRGRSCLPKRTNRICLNPSKKSPTTTTTAVDIDSKQSNVCGAHKFRGIATYVASLHSTQSTVFFFGISQWCESEGPRKVVDGGGDRVVRDHLLP